MSNITRRNFLNLVASLAIAPSFSLADTVKIPNSNIRGHRVNDIIVDEFSAVDPDILELVISNETKNRAKYSSTRM